MESPLFHLDLLTGHEPRAGSAGLRPGSILRSDTNEPGRRPALRFMESPLFTITIFSTGPIMFQDFHLEPAGRGRVANYDRF